MLVKLSGNNISQTISSLKQNGKALHHSVRFEYRFMDEAYNKLYSAELTSW